MENQTHKKPIDRLYFIDIARSIAILLMLEGHFVHDSLASIWENDEYLVYYIWRTIRGFTSPIFLTVTGLVFTYLLMGNNQDDFWKNKRILRGFKRVAELLFWGYLLQYYAFHVLQCIAFGILTIIIIYGVSKMVKIVPLWIYFFVSGLFLFYSYLFFVDLGDNYWPNGAPKVIQNIFHGPYSLFPITPNMAFTLFGAMLGVLLYNYNHLVKTKRVIFSAFIFGVLLFFGSKQVLIWINSFVIPEHILIFKLDWLFEKLGMVIIILSILLAVESFVLKIKKNNLFLKIGQNTLSIYILHMIILYGSITHLGINDFLHKKLDPYEILIYTLGFLSLFIVYVYYIDLIRLRLKFILEPIKKITNRAFGIQD